jgi:hypothetical protein
MTFQPKFDLPDKVFKSDGCSGGLSKMWAPLIWLGVRVGGGAYWPTAYKWGFGWTGGKK